jgi:hypothetical protein
MRHSSSVHLLWTALAGASVVLSLSACGDDSSGDGASTDGSNEGSAPEVILPPCLDSTDCAGGQICRGGSCREACDALDPCRGALPACDVAAGICEQCITSDDCPVGNRCNGLRRCEFFCDADEQCPQPTYCDFPTGTCFTAECERDDQCSGGFRCLDLRCVPIGGPDVECVSDVDCRGGFRCDTSRCVPIGG